MKYTITEFRAEFANDDVCLDKIFKLRFAKMPCCPQCSQETTFKRVKGRRAYQCSDKDCQYQLYPTAGTVFEKTRTPLSSMFYIIYLMTSTRNGVAAKEIERQLGVTYKCAHAIGHRIRLLMAQSSELLSGIVEADELFIGGAAKFMHKAKRDKLNENGTGTINKTPVLAVLQRGGEIRTRVLNHSRDANMTTMVPMIRDNVKIGSTLMTDGHGAYRALAGDYKHQVVAHERDEYVKGITHTNTIEGFFSQIKRTIKGTHIHVSRKHMQKYLDECTFRYVNRGHGQEMFYLILGKIAA